MQGTTITSISASVDTSTTVKQPVKQQEQMEVATNERKMVKNENDNGNDNVKESEKEQIVQKQMENKIDQESISQMKNDVGDEVDTKRKKRTVSNEANSGNRKMKENDNGEQEEKIDDLDVDETLCDLKYILNDEKIESLYDERDFCSPLNRVINLAKPDDVEKASEKNLNMAVKQVQETDRWIKIDESQVEW